MPILKVLSLAALAPFAVFSGGPALALAVPSPYGASFEMVPQLICANGQISGSGVRIAEGLIITAAHVNAKRVCTTAGVDLKNLRFEPGQDIAFVGAKLPDGYRAIISCEGIHEGGRYLALGYADGGAPDAETLIGTGTRSGNLTIMHGHVYHGMSGGAVLNEQGALVAIINAMNSEGRPVSFVTPLTQTYLCARA